ncbi:MAG: hypothetical protein J6U54_04285 [Clostridiales bacterium]|nr:hypothetical protein [Clostridiales bacterium]
MNSILNTIRERIEELEPGTIFLTGDFSDAASNPTLRKTLGRLCQEGIIRRVLDGVYEKPRYSNLLMEYVPTDPEAVAYAIARYYHWNIAPCGDVALNRLKLSTQVPVVWSYISDGPYRDYVLGNIPISFKHRTNRDVSGMSSITLALIEALKTLGKEYVDDNTIDILRKELSPQDKEVVLREASNSAEWIYKTIQKVCN